MSNCRNRHRSLLPAQHIHAAQSTSKSAPSPVRLWWRYRTPRSSFLGLDHRFRDDPLVVCCGQDLIQRFVLALGWPFPPLPWLDCLLRLLSRSRHIGLSNGNKALPLDGLHAQPAAGGGPADGGPWASGALPLDERHAHGAAGGDLGEGAGPCLGFD